MVVGSVCACDRTKFPCSKLVFFRGTGVCETSSKSLTLAGARRILRAMTRMMASSKRMTEPRTQQIIIIMKSFWSTLPIIGIELETVHVAGVVASSVVVVEVPVVVVEVSVVVV